MKLQGIDAYRKAKEQSSMADKRARDILDKDVKRAAKAFEKDPQPDSPEQAYTATILKSYGMLRDLFEAPTDGETLLDPETVSHYQFEVIKRKLQLPEGGIFSVMYSNHLTNPSRSLSTEYKTGYRADGTILLVKVHPTNLSPRINSPTLEELIPKAIADADTLGNICAAAGVEVSTVPTLEEALPPPLEMV